MITRILNISYGDELRMHRSIKSELAKTPRVRVKQQKLVVEVSAGLDLGYMNLVYLFWSDSMFVLQIVIVCLLLNPFRLI